MSSWCLAVAFVLADLLINSAILCGTYPIWREFAYQRYPIAYWIRVYFCAAAFATGIACCAAVVSLRAGRRKSLRYSLASQVLLTFGLLTLIAIACDFSEPCPACAWPELLQDISAKFFAELQSIRFTVACATSMPISSALLLLFFLKKTRTSYGAIR
jgi:hypothetical protein